MKIYFINPYQKDLHLYCKEIHDCEDISEKLNIGYNDSHEMRSTYLTPTYYSANPERLEKELLRRQQELHKQYTKEFLEKIRWVRNPGTKETAQVASGIDAPF